MGEIREITVDDAAGLEVDEFDVGAHVLQQSAPGLSVVPSGRAAPSPATTAPTSGTEAAAG